MIIDLGNIFVADGESISLDLSFDFSDVEYGGLFPFNEPAVFCGSISNHAGVVTLSGSVRCRYTAPCDRCSEICSDELCCDIDYVLVSALANNDEKDGFIVVSDNKLDIDEVILSDLILNVPMKHLCSADCKGICPQCGANLNTGKCSCRTKEIDPRLAALKELLD